MKDVFKEVMCVTIYKPGTCQIDDILATMPFAACAISTLLVYQKNHL